MYIVIGTILYMMIVSLTSTFQIVQTNASGWGIVFISVFVAFEVFRSSKEYVSVFLLAYLLRLGVLFLDFYGVLEIPGSGSDTEYFYSISANNVLYGVHQKHLTNYTVFLTFIYELMSPQRLFSQYLNVLFSLGALLFVKKGLELYEVSHTKILVALWITALFPQMLIFSGILLREAIVCFFVTASYYYLLEWFVRKKQISFVFSTIFLLGGAFFHSGVLGFLLGNLIIYTFYDNENEVFNFRFKTLIPLVIVALFFVVFVIKSGLFTDYLPFLNEGRENWEAGVLRRVNAENEAGSMYLADLKIDSFQSMILYSPLKLFYFLFSPMPWDFRGMMDVISFMLDSLFYVGFFYMIYFVKLRQAKYKYLRGSLLGFWIAVVLFSWGTIAAGTAIRHRAKFFPVLVIASVAIWNSKEDDNSVSYEESVDRWT